MNKRITFVNLLLFSLVVFFSCSSNEVPPEVLNCVSTYFPDSKIVHVERDHAASGIEFDITLNNGTEIEFDTSNKWKSIDCKDATSPIPIKILPKDIAYYLSLNNPNDSVIEMERDSYGYKLKLSSRDKLYFDLQGTLIRIGHDIH